MKNTSKSGFTLMELLVVIAIIGILASVTINAVSSAREKAKIAKVKSILRDLDTGVHTLGLDTGKWPVAQAATSAQDADTTYCNNAPNNNEVADLNASKAGLLASHAFFPDWNGPYVNTVPLDPWGNNYFFDSDYQLDNQGFPDYIGTVVGSYGPNGVGNNQYDEDDIVRVLVKEDCS